MVLSVANKSMVETQALKLHSLVLRSLCLMIKESQQYVRARLVNTQAKIKGEASPRLVRKYLEGWEPCFGLHSWFEWIHRR